MSISINEIVSFYGEKMCEYIGNERIYSLPEVKPNDLGMTFYNEYDLFFDYEIGHVVKPALLKNASAVRGETCNHRPFIAMKLEILDAQTKKRIDEVAEVIFQPRFARNKDEYISECGNDLGYRFKSLIQRSHAASFLTAGEMNTVKELLEGKEIPYPPINTKIMRLSASQ